MSTTQFQLVLPADHSTWKSKKDNALRSHLRDSVKAINKCIDVIVNASFSTQDREAVEALKEISDSLENMSYADALPINSITCEFELLIEACKIFNIDVS